MRREFRSPVHVHYQSKKSMGIREIEDESVNDVHSIHPMMANASEVSCPDTNTHDKHICVRGSASTKPNNDKI